jgi:hypothetical protein
LRVTIKKKKKRSTVHSQLFNGESMKKILVLAVLVGAAVNSWAQLAPPYNVGVYVCSAYVKRDSTGYTNPISFAGKTYKVLKVAFKDSTIGDGVTVKQYSGFITGRAFGKVRQDTIYDLVGDTVGSPYIHATGITLSPDSIVMSAATGAQLTRLRIGPSNTDSLYVLKGYKVLTPDPATLTRFSIRGNSSFSATRKLVYVIINVLEGHPVSR